MSSETSMILKGWLDAAMTIAPGVEGLTELLEDGLNRLVDEGRVDESHLLTLVDQAADHAMDEGAGEAAEKLVQRMRRSVYEYLLALDAAHDEVSTAPPPPVAAGRRATVDGQPDYIQPITDRGSFLIGAEEVAALARSHDSEEAATPMGVEVGVGGIVRAGAGTLEPEPEGDDGQASKRRFGLFRRSAKPGGTEAAPPPAGEATATAGEEVHELTGDVVPHAAGENAGAPQAAVPENGATAVEQIPPPPPPPPPAGTSAFEVYHVATPGEAEASPAEAPPEAAAPIDGVTTRGWEVIYPNVETPAAEDDDEVSLDEEPATPDGYAIAPRHGFHLGDPNEVDEADAEAEPDAEAEAGSPAARQDSAIFSQTGVSLDAGDITGADSSVDLTQARRAIDEKLKKKKCDEAGALLQQLAQDVGGREVAEMALDAGDRCRGLGKRQAATNCYLAASRADPVYETPWTRLADICIDDQDIDLAVSYLERVARLSRLRGDVRGSLRIYRKIVTIAPHREDILEMLMRAQATGRIEG